MAVERPGLALLGDPPRPPLPFEKVCAVMPLAAIRGGRGRLTQLRFRPILRRRLSPYLPRPNMVRGKDRVSSIDIAGKTVDAGRVGIKRGGPAVGLVLGSGAGRGFAHIGVMRALMAHGIAPDIIVGTSMGALVGGCYATNQLDALETWARSL